MLKYNEGTFHFELKRTVENIPLPFSSVETSRCAIKIKKK